MASRPLDEERIFHTARLLPNADARSDYLDQVCHQNQNLRDRVEALLRVQEQEGEFLASQNVSAIPTEDHAPVSERAGCMVGSYRLMEQIGEGGMGVVFVAQQQEPIRRKVALKVIKPGMDSQAVMGRFEAERQALAMMEHPNIARVLDAGQTDSGRPYFVMELVQGIPITQYCDERRLSIEDRLKLFIDVCHAIQHAHQKAIIHRDIKPTNVLVTEQDGKPVPKVIDFGVAKALNQNLTNRTVYTSFQSFIGTPLYASPEQASLSNVDVDTRSDVYSMGVLLYELLTGTTPFDRQQFEEAAIDEIRRILQQVEPVRPSTRISSLGDTAATISQARQTAPELLARMVRGDLDWIVMKAMDKERARRYETVDKLADDVFRHMSHEPVIARPPSYVDRIRKFTKRNKLPVIFVTAVAAALLIGFAGTYWQMIQARRGEVRLAEELYIADMSVARQAWAENNLSRVMEILERYGQGSGHEQLRQFEWYYLWAQTRRGENADSITLPRSVQSLAGCTGGGGVLAVAHDGSVYQVDLQRMKVSTLQQGVDGYYRTSGALSRDGTQAAFVKPDWRTIKIIRGEVKDDVEIACDAHVRTVCFIDSQTVAVSLASGVVEVIDVATQQRLKRHRFITESGTSFFIDLAVSPLKDCIAVGVAGQFHLWNITADTVRSIETAHAPGLVWVEFAPDGQTIATGGVHGLVKLWNQHESTPVHILTGHAHEIRGLSFSPDGRKLATSAKDGTVRLWDTSSGLEQDVLRGHGSDVSSVVFVDEGRQLISSAHRCLKIWRLDDERLAMQAAHDIPGESLTFCGEEQLLVRNRFTNAVSKIDTATGEDELLWEPSYNILPPGSDAAHPYDFQRLALTNSERLCVITNDSEGLEAWDLRSQRRRFMLENGGGFISTAEISLDGSLLAVGKNTGVVSVYSLTQREHLTTVKVGDSLIRKLAFSPGGLFLSVASDDGHVTVVRPDTGNQVSVLSTEAELITALAHSTVSDELAVGTWDGIVRIWNIHSGDVVGTLAGHRGIVRVVLYSHDGRSIFSAGEDKTIKIWDVKHQRERFTFTGSSRAVRDVALSPSGKTLASVTWDGVISFWRAAGETGQVD